MSDKAMQLAQQVRDLMGGDPYGNATDWDADIQTQAATLIDAAIAQAVAEATVNKDALVAENKRLAREIDILRIYGDKDCTAMADEALAASTAPASGSVG